MSAGRTLLKLTGTALAAALALAGCSGGSQPDGNQPGGGTPTQSQATQDDFDKAMSTPTKLLFWTWVNDIQTQVDLFEKQYPEIDVEVVNAGQGAEQYQQLRTALQAGSGAPDVAQIEFQYLASFRISNDLLDLSPYVGDLSTTYPDWIWQQVYKDGGLWAIPQDTGPMGHLYRDDLFTAAGIEVPETWADFATAAETYRAANPDSYITNLPGNNPGQFVALLWQNGAKPFSYDGDKTVGINLSSPEVTTVLEYWNDLIQKDLVGVDPDFNDQWYQGLANDKYAGWLVAAWGPLFLQGTVANTSGKWRAAELPQWTAGEHVSSNWGGSTSAVMSSTENPIAAAELSRYINIEKEPATLLATQQFLFPATKEMLADETVMGKEFEFYGGQKVNQKFAEISETVSPDFDWLPIMDYAYASYNETLGKAIAERTDLVAGAAAWEAEMKTYAAAQGFTVN